MTLIEGRRPAHAGRTEQEAWAILMSAQGLGPAGLIRLVEGHGSGRAVLEVAERPTALGELVAMSRADPARSHDPDRTDETATTAPREWLDPDVAAAIVTAVRRGAMLLRRLRQLGVGIMTLDDSDYPARLLAMEHPPPVLFVRGDRTALSAERSVAVVGTRRPTQPGLRLAGDIAGAISHLGGVVVSGLALGIDGAAHEAAVRQRRPTVGVLGSGHARLYPADHRNLADAILATGGCVISELPPDVSGMRHTFPNRNRIISGLSDAVVVVEAPPGSGALITADHAMGQGRECFIAPGPVGARASEGCLRYLRGYPGQARVVVTVPLLLEDLGFRVETHRGAAPSALQLGQTETLIAGLVVDGRATVDLLVAATQLPVSAILAGLTLLEMRGLISAAYGRYRPSGALLPAVEAGGRRPVGPSRA